MLGLVAPGQGVPCAVLFQGMVNACRWLELPILIGKTEPVAHGGHDDDHPWLPADHRFGQQVRGIGMLPASAKQPWWITTTLALIGTLPYQRWPR